MPGRLIEQPMLMLFALTAGLTVSAVFSVTLYSPAVRTAAAPAPVAGGVVMPRVIRSGGEEVQAAGPVSVRTRTSSRVRLQCGAWRSSASSRGGVARFGGVPAEGCQVAVGSAAPYGPVFPGDRLSCAVTGEVTGCTGGVADRRAARATVTADVDGRLEVDGEDAGTLPLRSLKVPVGEHALAVVTASGQRLEWSLTVRADERLDLHFPTPRWVVTGDGQAAADSGIPAPQRQVRCPPPEGALRAFAWAVLGLWGCGSGAGLSTGRLPESTSVLEIPEPEAVLVVDRSDVFLDGAHLVDTDQLATAAGQSAIRRALSTRAAALRSAASADPSAPAFRGAVALEIDRDLPARTLVAALNSAAMAEFAKPWLVVASHRQRRGIGLTVPRVAAAGVATSDFAVSGGSYANPRIEVDPARGFVVHAHDDVVDPGSGTVIPCVASPCGDTWPVVELNRLARRIKLDHPRDRAVAVHPDPGAPVQALVYALDATRHDAYAGRGSRELFPDALIFGEPP